MNRFLGVSSLLISVALLTACASNARVRSDHNTRIQSDFNTSLDFSQYQTYNFRSVTAIENPDFSEFIRLQYREAIEQQMNLRGYSKADNPDILINVSVNLKDMTSVPRRRILTPTPRYNKGPSTACPNSGAYDGRGIRFASSSGSVSALCEFKQGSVSVDIVGKGMDLNQMIWAGTLNVRIAENEPRVYLLPNIEVDAYFLIEASPFRDPEQLAWVSESD